MEESLASPVQESEPSKPSKREGNQYADADIPAEQAMPTHAKTSRRTTSLLNLFMSNSQGMCREVALFVDAHNPGLGCFFQGHAKAELGPAVPHLVPPALPRVVSV